MRLIDGDAAAAFAENCGATFVAKKLRDSKAFPEVVTRCKDCEYLVNATVNANGFLICNINDMEIAPNDFCSYGEPKS